MEVVACGFPFGKALTVVKDDYPAVSINKGAITSLRRKMGELHRIQVDAVLNPGNSGGPVLGLDGKVIGVVVSGVRGSQISFVIPIGYLSRFLEKPELSFAAPKLAREVRGKPAAFEARAVSLVPGSKPPELELVLTVGDKVRRFPMKRDGDTYRASAIPLPAVEGPASVRATVSYRAGSVTGLVRDRAVRIDGKERKLSEVRTIRRVPTAAVEFRDGKTFEGRPIALDDLEVDLGGETLKLRLSSAVAVAFDVDEASSVVTCLVVAKSGGKVVAEAGDSLSFGEPGGLVAGPPVGVAKLDGDSRTVTLPAAATDAVMAGGGRYLLLQLSSLRKVAIFDVTQAKVTGYIPLGAENAKIAAGQGKLVVYLPDDVTFQRWDVATQKRELAVPVKLMAGHTVKHVAMGCASDGPVAFTASDNNQTSGEIGILDLATLKPLELKRPRDQVNPHADCPLRASADGKTFGSFQYGSSPQGVRCLTIHPGEVRSAGNGDSSGHVTPGDDGRFLYTGRGIYTAECKAVGTTGRAGLYCLPAVRGPYYLGMALNGEGAANKHKAHLFLAGDARPLAAVGHVSWPQDMNEWDREVFTWDRRIWLVPEAKVLITIPSANRVVLHRLDAEAALERSAIDYLVVTSRPPATARKGEALRYQLRVKSKKGGVKYELSSGPKGMEVTKAGEVRWAVPARYEEDRADAVVAVSDASGQEVMHRFTVAVE